MRFRRSAYAIAICAGSLAACSSANYNPVVTSSPSPLPSSATSAPTPSASATASTLPSSACGTAQAGAVFIAIGSYIEPANPPDATYGSTYGYALVDAAGNYPLKSTPIVLRPGDSVQFVNVDPPDSAGGPGTSHTATGLESTTFPNGHTFASDAFSASGATFTNARVWSTGAIPAIANALCYSQVLLVPASGTFAFGDAAFYNTTNFRDVLVVSPNAAR